MSRPVYEVTCPMCGEVFNERLRKCPNCRAKNRKDVCRTCGNEISKQARKCPSCGARHIQKISDGGIIAILVTLLLVTIIQERIMDMPNSESAVEDASSFGSSAVSDAPPEAQAETDDKNEVVSRENYIAKCDAVLYNDVARNPDNYDGEKVMFSGTVIQVSEDALDLFSTNSVDFRVETTDGIWYVSYNRPEGESRILEGDYITCYGECDGVTTYISVLGGNVTVPKLIMKYHD